MRTSSSTKVMSQDFHTEAPVAAETPPMVRDVRTVSVVIPAFNSARFIGACVESLRHQTLPPLEIIVVNDASTDATSDIAEKAGAKVFNLEGNAGPARARAYGAAKASGGLVAFIDSDCTAPVDWILSLVGEFEADPELCGVGGRYEHPRGKSASALLAKLEEEYAHDLFAETPFESNPPGGNSAYLRDTWLKKRSGSDVYLFRDVRSGEDDFACNELRKAGRVKFTSSLKVMHQPRNTGGYFKRHVNRGRSFAFGLIRRLGAGGEGSLKAYGGAGLFFASLALILALAAILAMPITPIAGIAAMALFAVFFALARGFSRFISKTNENLSSSEKITFFERAKISLLISARSLCWVAGAASQFAKHAVMKAKQYVNVVLSIAHFWMPGRISKLFYFVTSACNARCEFCFNLENVVNWKARKPQELTLAEVEKIAAKLKRLPYMNLSGGEPFMRKDLADVVEVFHKKCKTQWVTIPTNAALTKPTLEITQEILTRCPTMFLIIQISIDGMHETHDKSRKIRGGFDAMIKTLKGLSELRKLYPNLRVQIATCYDDFNVAQIPEIVQFCRDNFEYDQQMFYLIRETGKLITQSTNHLVPSFFKTLAENEDFEWGNNRRSLWSRAVRALQNVTYSDVVEIKRSEKFIRPCHATRKFVTLYDDGQISPCEVLDTVNLGNIKDFGYDFYKLRDHKAEKYYREDIVKKKCNCDWMCAVPINMLYDVKVFPRVAKALINPDKIAPVFDSLRTTDVRL